MSVITITLDDLEDLARSIELTPQHETSSIMVGDWVKLEDSGLAAAHSFGHVVAITAAGNMDLAHGGRNESRDLWRYSCRPKHISKVTEVWRRFSKVERETFESDGRTINVTSISDEWRQVR